MTNLMQITADDAREALAYNKTRPQAIVVRLHFTFDIENERSQRPRTQLETIGIMIEPGRTREDIEARLRKALDPFGAAWDRGASQLNNPWRVIDLPNGVTPAALSVVLGIKRPAIDISQMPDDQTALDTIATMARQSGQLCSEALGAVGWRRADDIQGASSVMSALGMAFDDLASLYDALEIKKELALVTRPAPASVNRPAL